MLEIRIIKTEHLVEFSDTHTWLYKPCSNYYWEVHSKVVVHRRNDYCRVLANTTSAALNDSSKCTLPEVHLKATYPLPELTFVFILYILLSIK